MKDRLDIRMVERGLCQTRARARQHILAGEVSVNGTAVTKPGTMVDEDAEITLCGDGDRYVGRGGYKLEKALGEFGIDLTGLTCVDAGASTGGFTDCMLQNGASLVYAVDVGTDQLAEKLRNDPRVVSMEQTNIRDMTGAELKAPVDFLAADLSFISLSKVLPAFASLIREGGRIVCLIKPQFEAGREHIGKNGIVKDPRVHRNVIVSVTAAAAEQGFACDGITFSPITGGSGNREYLFTAVKTLKPAAGIDAATAERIVHEAFLYHSKQGKGS
ncbi:MAG: TlyA family RNA methyltransferase [Lachnospiraceae bacterium]|nr:TlyA family RNA methyltransferase [Lachnospiraceae bacterium]